MRALGHFIGAAMLGSLLTACGGTTPATSSRPPSAPPTAVAAPASAGAPPEVAQAPARAVVRYGYVGVSAAFWVMYVAETQGFLDREGVDFDKLATTTGIGVIQALAGGSLDIGLAAPDTTILAIERGAPLSIVAGGYNRVVYTLVVQPTITRVSDLRDKSIGVSGLKAADAFILRRMLARGGLKDDDYDLTAASTSNDRLVALQSGIVAGTILTQPFDFQAADSGARLLAKSTDDAEDYQFTVMIANSPWAVQNQAVMTRLLRAYHRAALWLQDPANKEQAIDVLVTVTQTQPKYARMSYQLYQEEVKALTPDGSVNMPGLKTVVDLLGEAGDLAPPLPPPSKYVDESYLAKARGN